MTDKPNVVRMILRHESADGSVLDTPYIDSSGVPDPYVRSRMAPTGPHASPEIITEYAPAPERPVSYPPGLPFIPHRAVFTTSAPPTVPSGARWLCADVTTLLELIVSASVAEGWRRVPRPPKDRLLGAPDVVLQREAIFRELRIVPVDSEFVLQLWDVPSALFDPRPV